MAFSSSARATSASHSVHDDPANHKAVEQVRALLVVCAVALALDLLRRYVYIILQKHHLVHPQWLGISVEVDMMVSLLLLETGIGSATGLRGVLGKTDIIVIIIVVDIFNLVAPKTVALPTLRRHPCQCMDVEELAGPGRNTASRELPVDAAAVQHGLYDRLRMSIAFTLTQRVAPRSSPSRTFTQANGVETHFGDGVFAEGHAFKHAPLFGRMLMVLVRLARAVLAAPSRAGSFGHDPVVNHEVLRQPAPPGLSQKAKVAAGALIFPGQAVRHHLLCVEPVGDHVARFDVVAESFDVGKQSSF